MVATARAKPKAKTWEDVLKQRTSGFLSVRSDGQPPFKWRPRLATTLRDVDKSKEAWGVRTEVYDCSTKRRLFEFRSLGA